MNIVVGFGGAAAKTNNKNLFINKPSISRGENAMRIRLRKFWQLLNMTLATILFCVAFIKPALSQSSPDQPFDIYLPLVTGNYPPLPAIHNGDFELGNNGDWTEYSGSDLYYLIGQPIPFITPSPHSGGWLAWLGGVADDVYRLSQAVTLPADGPLYLRYYYQVYSDKNVCNLDWMLFKVSATVLISRGLCSAENTTDWVAETVDLSAYAGQTITIMFEVTTNSATATSSFFIDDVSLSRTP